MPHGAPNSSAGAETTHAADRLCLGTIEACILGAVAIIPIVYEANSEMLYQIPKAVVLHGLAFILLCALCARWLLRLRSPPTTKVTWGGSLKLPILACVGLAATSLASALFSVDPFTGFFGRFQWKEGWFDLCSLMLFFLAAAGALRSREQQDRLLTTLLVASLPVSICAILQRHHLSEDQGRAYSTLGSAIFLGDYLAPLIPLTLWRLAGQWRWARNSTEGRKAKALSALAYLLLAALQACALFLTNSRGSSLSLLGGLLLWGALSYTLKHRRLMAWGFASLAGLALCLMVASRGPLPSVSLVHLLDRLDQAWPRHGQSISYRTHLWKAAADTATSPEPIRCPDESTDRWQYLRPFIGFGLDNQPFVLLQHLSETDRSPDEVEYDVHNLAWEKWLQLGAFGSMAFISIPVFVFFLAFKRIGMITSRKDTQGYGMALAAGALGGAVAFTAWGGLAFAGIGVQLGCFAGLLVFALVRRNGENFVRPFALAEDQRGFVNVALSSLAICLLCTITEPATVATLMNYWVLLGLLASLAEQNALASSVAAEAAKDTLGAPKKEKLARAQATAAGRQGWRPCLLAALIAAMVLVSLIQNFVAGEPGANLSLFELLGKCLFEPRLVSDFALPVWMAIFSSWLGASWLLTSALTERRGNMPKWSQFGFVAVTSGGIGLLFAVLRAWQMSKIGPLLSPSATPASMVHEAVRYELAFPLYFWSICALLLVGGLLLSQSDLTCSARGPTSKMLLFLCGSCVVVVSAPFVGGVRSVQADVSCHFAEFLQLRGNRPAAIDLYRRAVKLEPHSFFYREQLAYALGTLANFAPDRESFERWNQERESVLESEQGLFVSRSARMLGLACLEWAAGENLQEQIHQLALRASRAFHRATLFDPHNSVVWMENAMVDSLFLGQKEEASREKAKALDLAAHQGCGNLGGYYLERSTFEPRAAQVRSMQALAAILYFREAMRDPKAGEREAFAYKISIADSYLLLKDFKKAVEVWQESLTNAPPEEIWRSEEFQARLELSQTNKSQALRHVESALSKAPPSAIEELTVLKNFMSISSPQ